MNSNQAGSMEPGEVPVLDIKKCRCCSLEKSISLFVKNKGFKSGIDTICLECSRDKVKAWRKSGKRDYRLERKRRLSKYGEALLKRESLLAKARREKLPKKEKRLKTKEEQKATKYKSESKRKLRMRYKNWDQELTDLVLIEAKHLTFLRKEITSLNWHIDHIIPLNGEFVSGLHVWNNIQVITEQENIKKGNKYDIV